jgi:hypothetical protein
LFDYFIWQITGYEVLEVNSQDIILQKKGKIFPNKNIIKLETVESISITDYKYLSWTDFIFVLDLSKFAKLLGETGGKICVEYSKNSINFGQGLTEEEAIELVAEIKQYMQPNLCETSR